MLNRMKPPMDEEDEESFTLPPLEDDDDVGMTHCSSWNIITSASEEVKSTPVNDDERVSATFVMELRVNSNDSFPNHLVSLDGTNLKDDASIVSPNYEFLDQPADGIENRKRTSQISSPPSTQKALREESLLRTAKDRVLFFCLAFLLMTTGTLTLKLNVSKTLNLQLQEELNQTTVLLKSYRAHQRWIMDREIKDDISLFEIENCWLESSVTLGPCASDLFGNIKDVYKKSYEDFFLYADEAWKWWTVLPNDSNPSYSHSDPNDSNPSYSHSDSNDPNPSYSHSNSAEISLFEQVVKFVSLNMKEASMQIYPGVGSSNTTLYQSYQSHLKSEIESWFGGGSK